jgi:hypothetical protein
MSFQPVQCSHIGFFKQSVHQDINTDLTSYMVPFDAPDKENYGSRTAIVWLTVRPPEALFRFAEKLNRDSYDSYVVVDANDYVLPSYDDKKVKVIKYEQGVAEARGYKNSVLWVENRAASRCKALYHFAEVDTSYDWVWFIEEDVFVPSLNTVRHLDKLYPEGDLICTGNEINTTGELESWPWWAKLKPLIALPWSKSMIQAIRLSPRMFREISTFVKEKGTLLFDEGMFTTLAIHANLKIVNPPELSNLVYWHRVFDVNEFKPFHMYHPVKSWNQHNQYKDEMGMEYFHDLNELPAVDVTFPSENENEV